MTTIGELRPAGREADIPTEQWYGIEVEVEGCRRYDVEALGTWQPKPDGSLRNRGMEFVTPPVTYHTAIEMVTGLWGQMRRYGWQANNRTGIHVHMDMQRLTLDEFKKWMVAYLCVEPVLFDLCGEAREENIYCVPWYRSQDDMEHLLSMFERRSITPCVNTCKYSALYLEPLRRFGTVEFRGAPTWQDSGDMIQFLRLLELMRVRAAQARTPESILDLFEGDTMAGLRHYAGRDIATHDRAALIEDRDSLGVASLLVRTRQDVGWEFPEQGDAPPNDAQRGYYHNGGFRMPRMRGGRPRYGIPPIQEEQELVDLQVAVAMERDAEEINRRVNAVED
jgi:hypothetical protein